MAKTKTPDEVMKKIQEMTDDELKDAIVRTCIRQGRAEADLAHYKESYGEVIKEEKQQRETYLMVLEMRADSARLRLAADKGVEDATTDAELEKASEIVRLVQGGAQA